MNLPTNMMKKLLIVLIAAFSVSACTEDITRNDPALQGMKDNVEWRAGGQGFALDADGSIRIEGSNQFETLIIELPSALEGTYVLGQNENAMATFIYDNGFESYTYSTGTGNPNAGEVVITDYYSVDKILTGRFRFNALLIDDNPLVAPVLNFQYGVFHNLRIN
ncbi:MAG: hypothetical protein ITG00_02930 [Flavobacterium sp.]|nr:hypothetical protein [Flavobacterium sp.]